MAITGDPIEALEQRADATLDVRGLDCPLPVLKARACLNGMSPGQTLLVLATDPHSTVDFKAFCARTPVAMITHGESAAVFYFLLEKRQKRGET